MGKFGLKKLGSSLYRIAWSLFRYVEPFMPNCDSQVWQTDRRTRRRTDGGMDRHSDSKCRASLRFAAKNTTTMTYADVRKCPSFSSHHTWKSWLNLSTQQWADQNGLDRRRVCLPIGAALYSLFCSTIVWFLLLLPVEQPIKNCQLGLLNILYITLSLDWTFQVHFASFSRLSFLTLSYYFARHLVRHALFHSTNLSYHRLFTSATGRTSWLFFSAHRFSSSGWAYSIARQKLSVCLYACVCLCVNQGGPDRNRDT